MHNSLTFYEKILCSHYILSYRRSYPMPFFGRPCIWPGNGAIHHEEFRYCFGRSFMMINLPFLHCGQQVISSPVSRNIISAIVSFIFSGITASELMRCRMILIAFFLFLWDKNPKYRIFVKLPGNTWSKNLRINSWAEIVIALIASLSFLSL